MNLLIVESPAKAKAIQHMLGLDWAVIASKGHICDLPSNDIGIDRHTLKPTYVLTEKGKHAVAAIRAKLKGIAPQNVFLATDPDREGEAIAGHLASVLKLKAPQRVTYNEVNETAIRRALAVPRPLNTALLAAQNLRRCEDRLGGYILSGPLARYLNTNSIGIGRVQAAALALIAEREKKISGHVPSEHYTVTLDFSDGEIVPWAAKWQIPQPPRQKIINPSNAVLDLDNQTTHCIDTGLANRVAAIRNLTVINYSAETVGRLPPPPLVTVSLMATAGRLWNYEPDVVMNAAQKLFEGTQRDDGQHHGYITYHRTDVPTVSSEKAEAIRAYADQNGLPIPTTPNKHKGRNSNAQEGHEAILPTDIADTGLSLTDPVQRNVYTLIRARALISQLAPAQYDKQTIDLSGTDANGAAHTFRATGQRLRYAGYLSAAGTLNQNDIDGDPDDLDNRSSPDATLPVLQVGQHLQATSGQLHHHRTTPPPRYTQETLLAKMEYLSIGRPSTYATIFGRIKEHGYVTTNGKRQFTATSLGLSAYEWIYPRFSFASLNYTQKQEALYDSIANNSIITDPQTILGDIWSELEAGLASLPDSPQQETKPCPKCGKAMLKRNGKKGAFWGCSGYRDKSCTHTENA